MLVVRNIGTLVTCEPTQGNPLGLLHHAALLAADHLIAWYGPEDELPTVPLGTPVLDAHGQCVMPGLVDSHSHLLHVGSRANEFAARARGATYLDLAGQGGGIMASVRAVRAASEEQLVDAALPRLARLLANGVTTLELKSGYGLTVDDELKLLRAARLLAGLQPIELVATFLGAHTVPAEHRGAPDHYVDLVMEEMLPAVADARLARFCDIYIEQGAFSVAQARRILTRAHDLGLELKAHIDQFNALGGTGLAAELQLVSADHLEVTRPKGMRELRSADVVAVILPTCEVYLGRGGPAPGRALVDAGLRVAVASDFNPGTANCESLTLAATVAVSRCGLTVEEALLGITRHAAAAVSRDDIGRIYVGAQADLLLLDVDDPVRVVADLGLNHVQRVVKAGKLVWVRE